MDSLHNWLMENEPPVDEDATQPVVSPAAQSLWTTDQAAAYLGVTPIIFRMFANGIGSVTCAGLELYYADAVIGITDDPVAGALLAIIRRRHTGGAS